MNRMQCAVVAMACLWVVDASAQGRGGGRGFGPSPMMMVLDADRDGTISASEIAGASAALKKLDKNGDGQLTMDELRPPRGERGEGRGGFGQRLQRLMEFDKNKDGKLSASELPEPMQGIMDRADTNGDGSLTKAEIDALIQNFENFGGGRRGRGPQEGRRSNRPQRPTRPQ